jgi:UDP-N-acetylglucosamine 4,6-dehydratase/5-epimerase
VKTVLITGGSGFLGRHLALALKNDYRVVLGSRNQLALLEAGRKTGCEALAMDITNIESVRDVFNSVKPDIVIHAGASKYVDLAEKQPMECIDVNVVGSQNVARVAMDRNIELVVGISTDKAAPPARTTYGLSKSMMERMFCALDGKNGKTQFICVRFGNIAWSSGSVFCLWQEMFDASDKPVIESTGPHMRRFFCTVDEAVGFVIEAMAWSKALHGTVLVKQMKAAQMSDILDVWVKDNGGSWKQIDERPGDQLDEFLVGDCERTHTEELCMGGQMYYVISMSEKAQVPLPFHPSSANAERFTQQELSDLLNSRKRWI